MKKPQRSFVVEYKSDRRKVDSKAPSSIWGNLDLKSVARDVETALPVQGEPSKEPETPAPGTRAPAQLAPTSTDTVMVESLRLAPSVLGDDSVDSNVNDKQDVGADAVPAIQERKSGTDARRRRMPAGQSHPQVPMQVLVEHNVELDDLEQLEEESRLQKTMLAAKLRRENSWLRERLEQR